MSYVEIAASISRWWYTSWLCNILMFTSLHTHFLFHDQKNCFIYVLRTHLSNIFPLSKAVWSISSYRSSPLKVHLWLLALTHLWSVLNYGKESRRTKQAVLVSRMWWVCVGSAKRKPPAHVMCQHKMKACTTVQVFSLRHLRMLQ